MLVNTIKKPIHPNKIIIGFLLFWTVLNIIQASTLELQADEAYYWLYSKYLAWGYFDHPPMVAILIKLGDTIVHNEFGLRLFTIIFSTSSIYLLWLIAKKYALDAYTFVLIVSGIFIFHIYGFTTTPDVPLFFFTVLFFFLYQQYLEKDNWLLAILLGIIIACLLYSKYNGILLVGFTLLSNISILKRWSFWGITVIAISLFIPHILWQINHGYPTINYHLFERSDPNYNFINTISYLPAQFLMAGPLIGWFLFYKAFTVKIKDAFLRCLLVNYVGTLLFFLLSSGKGEVQPQWTFVLFAPLVILALLGIKQSGGKPKWFAIVAIINLSIIIFVRIIVITGFGFARTYGHLKSYYGFKEWVDVVKQHAGNHYVVMNDGFQNPAKYNYYTNSLKCFSYDDRGYRRTQFEIWPMEDSMQHEKVYYLTDNFIKGISTDSIKLEAGTWYGGWVNDFRSYQKINFEPEVEKLSAIAGQKINLKIKFTNPYPYPIDFSNTSRLHAVSLEVCLIDSQGVMTVEKAPNTFNSIKLNPNQIASYKFSVNAPTRKGNYELFFSLKAEPFPGSKNSKVFKLAII
jgi:hypothetical protein